MTQKFLYRIFCGFLLGLSIFAPGFSGSLIAINMGIYQDLVRIMSNPLKDIKKNINYCLPLGIGGVISAILFVIVFEFLFETYLRGTILLCIGFIAGNLPIVMDAIKQHTFKKRYIIGGAISFKIALIVALLSINMDTLSGNGYHVSHFLMFAIGGLMAGAVAFMPGMSLSTILMTLGIYGQLIFIASSFLSMDFSHLAHVIVFGLSTVCGLILASKGIKILFEKAPGLTNALVFGFILGSMIGIFIQSLHVEDANFNWIFGSIMLIVGLIMSILFVKLGKNINKAT